MIVSMQSTLRPILESSLSRTPVLPDLDAIGDKSAMINNPVIGLPSLSSLERGPVDTPASPNLASQPRSKGGYRTYQVEATVQNRCPPLCKCQCHKVQTSRSPDFLSGLIGRFMLSYNTVPIWGKPACTLRTCRRISKTPARLNYAFPSWMLKRAVHLSFSAANTASLGIQIDFPRIVPFESAAYWTISGKSLVKLQYMFSIGSASPMDIDEEGYSLLLVSMKP